MQGSSGRSFIIFSLMRDTAAIRLARKDTLLTVLGGGDGVTMST